MKRSYLTDVRCACGRALYADELPTGRCDDCRAAARDAWRARQRWMAAEAARRGLVVDPAADAPEDDR